MEETLQLKELETFLKDIGAYKLKWDNERTWKYHCWFLCKGLRFSIITYGINGEYFVKNYKQLRIDDIPMWEIYCFDVDCDIERAEGGHINDLMKFINKCVRKSKRIKEIKK